MRCVMSGIYVAFSEHSVQRYKKAVQLEEAADSFIEYQLTEMDNATNMDW
jgi:hypothetical protein